MGSINIYMPKTSVCCFRKPLPDSVKSILEEGIDLFRLHNSKHGRYLVFISSYQRFTHGCISLIWSPKCIRHFFKNAVLTSSDDVSNAF